MNPMKHVDVLIERYPELESQRENILEAYKILEESYANGGKLVIAGNGGSAADAEHIVGELFEHTVAAQEKVVASLHIVDIENVGFVSALQVWLHGARNHILLWEIGSLLLGDFACPKQVVHQRVVGRLVDDAGASLLIGKRRTNVIHTAVANVRHQCATTV